MPEDADGVVIVERRAAELAPVGRAPFARARVTPADLADRLLAADPAAPPRGSTDAHLAALAPRLDAAQVAVLAHALDHDADVRITYRNSAGNRTVRVIRPLHLYGRWISAWCHLRSADREFSVAGIEAVAPVG
jgi:predicted DNA-binding transcriptional regulator YafY